MFAIPKPQTATSNVVLSGEVEMQFQKYLVNVQQHCQGNAKGQRQVEKGGGINRQGGGDKGNEENHQPKRNLHGGLGNATALPPNT